MNYLAHLYFSDLTPESCVGQLLPDCMPPHQVLTDASPTLAEHIRLHQAIDRYTDHYPAVVDLRRQFQPPYRRFAGILLDVRFDQSLARDWQQYHSAPLASFEQAVYRALADYYGPENDRLRQLRRALVRRQWLGEYQHDSGVQRALTSLDRRSRFYTPLADAAAELTRLDNVIEETFRGFFPALRNQVAQLRHSGPKR